MNVNSTVLPNMTPIKRKCFPLFSFMHFIAWLIPWPPACDSWIYSQAPREISSLGESTILKAQTDETLLVSDNDLKYLTREEAAQIIERFKEIPQSYDRLVFWTGIPREWVQQWADDHGMLTLTSAMGPLMDRKDERCLRRIKKPKEWSKYIKGASVIFARYACRRGIVRLLTLPPSWAEFIRPRSTYRTIEEPILKGALGCCCAVEIHTVHLLTTLEELEYQTWPENRMPDTLSCRDTSSFSFRLPSWTQDTVTAATKSLQSNVVSFPAFPSPKPAGASILLQRSVKGPGRPPTAKQPKAGKRSEHNTSARGSLQSQCQQPQSKTRWPQTQQSSSKKQQPQNQQSSSQKQQPTIQQSFSRKEQPHTQQPAVNKEQPQIQLAQSKNQQSQRQQPPSKKQCPQSPQTPSKKKQPQTKQLSSNKGQPKTQQLPIKKDQPQRQQTQNEHPQSKKPQPQNDKQPQQGKQPQRNKKLIIKAGP
jgi:hypothetical protein